MKKVSSLLFDKSFLFEFGVIGLNGKAIDQESARPDSEIFQEGSNASPPKVVDSLEHVYVTGQEKKTREQIATRFG